MEEEILEVNLIVGVAKSIYFLVIVEVTQHL